MTKTFMPTPSSPSSIFTQTLFISLSEAPPIVLGSSHGPVQHLQSRYWLRTKEPERVIDIFLISVSNLLLLLPSVVKARKRSREHVSRMNFIVGLDITSRLRRVFMHKNYCNMSSKLQNITKSLMLLHIKLQK